VTLDLRMLAGAVEPDWPLIDRIWGEVARARDVHLQRQTASRQGSFLVEAFAVASAHGFLGAFIDELVKYGLIRSPEGTEGVVAALGGLGDLAFEFQSFVSGNQPAGDVLVYLQRGLKACDYVCRVDVDGRHAGTGVYLGAGLVVTAAHVVRDLVVHTAGRAAAAARTATAGPAPGGGLAARPGSLARLSLTFGYAMTLSGTGTKILHGGVVAPLHRDWLYWGSRTEPDPADVRDVTAIAEPDGPWDLLLIRLAEPLLLPWQPELRRDLPPAPAPVVVLQHPHDASAGGQPMMFAQGRLETPLGDPVVRFLHSANTERGSSGGPVFDLQWRVVGIHQGGPVPGGLATGARQNRNRAVPVRAIASAVDRLGLAATDVPTITELRPVPRHGPRPYPVIGRAYTQQRLWRGLARRAPATDRLLVIRGAPGTGLRFSRRLVQEYVERAGDPVVALDLSNALDDSAEQLADRIAGAMSADLAVIPHDGMTTRAREIREEILPALGGSWRSVAGSHLVWLVLEGFGEEAYGATQPVRDLVSGIIESLESLPMLRLVLIGWVESVPPGFGASVDELCAPTPREISAHLLPRGEEPGPELVRAATAAMAEAEAHGRAGYDLAGPAVEILQAMPAAAEALREIWSRRSNAEREEFQTRLRGSAGVAAVPGEVSQTVLRRAALSGAVRPADLIRGIAQGDRALDVLRLDFDRVRDDRGWFWTLRGDRRHAVLRTMGDETLRDVLRDVSAIPTDPPGGRLRELCAGEAVSPTGPETAVQALTWAIPLRGRLSDLAEAHRLAAVNRLLDDHRVLIREGVFGRAAVLERLRSFAGEPVEAGGGVPMLAVTGIGGSGKSTVLAQFANPYLENLMAAPAAGPLVVVIDFDRLQFRPGRELEMSFEVTRQLGMAHPEAGADFAAMRTQAREDRRRAGGDRYGAAHAADQDRREVLRFEHDVAVIVRMHQLDARPVLVLLDTFEEWQRERPHPGEERGPGNDSERHLVSWLTRLRQDMGLRDLKAIISGRAAPAGAGAAVVHLGDLDPSARRELLMAHGVEPRQAERIADRLGNPLTLRLAARILPPLGPDREAAFLSEAEPEPVLDEAIRRAVLYRRHLGHITDPQARRVAHPGLPARRAVRRRGPRTAGASRGRGLARPAGPRRPAPPARGTPGGAPPDGRRSGGA
jgi:hypothetical protein